MARPYSYAPPTGHTALSHSLAICPGNSLASLRGSGKSEVSPGTDTAGLPHFQPTLLCAVR